MMWSLKDKKRGHKETLSTTPRIYTKDMEEDNPKFNKQVSEYDAEDTRNDHFTPQTHAYGPKDSLRPAPHSCCMQNIPPTLTPDQSPWLQAAKVALTKINTSNSIIIQFFKDQDPNPLMYLKFIKIYENFNSHHTTHKSTVWFTYYNSFTFYVLPRAPFLLFLLNDKWNFIK